MPLCCPPARGCNDGARREPCALKLFREAARYEPLAALALARWEDAKDASRRADTGRHERRFRRRAYERARDAALVAVLMRRSRVPARRRARTRSPSSIGVLRARHRAGPRR